MTATTILTFFSALSFLIFGIACFTTVHMKSEFRRYGLAKFRKTIGGLQLLGALGLLIGYLLSPKLQIAAAGSLAFLMVLGFIVRLKIRDSFLEAAPSFFYAILNAYLLLLLLK